MQNNSQTSDKQATKVAKIHEIENFVFKRYDLRKNTVSNELEGKGKSSKDGFRTFQEEELSYALYSAGFGRFKEELRVILVHKVVSYDPIQAYFEGLPKWDGETDHIKYLASFLNVEDPVWFLRMFRKWLVRVFIQASGLKPDYFNKQCLTLVGKQNDGKTSFLDFLVPPQLKPYSRKGFTFGSKDGLISLTQNFLINLDELASFDKKEINNEFKSVLSESSVKFRALYQPNERSQPRRASFMASTNEFEFLTDPTGNVRWLPFVIRGVNHDNGGTKGYNQKVNIDLVWSQVYALHKSGFEAEMQTDEVQLQESLNKNFVRSTLEMELIRKHYEPSDRDNPQAVFMPVCDIAEELKAATRYNLNSILVGKALLSIGFKQHRTAYSRGYYVIKNKLAENAISNE